MNCISILILFFLLIVKIRADFTDLESPENLKKSEENQKKSFAEHFATLLGILSFHTVLTYISPIILKTAFLPLFLIIKFISKPLMMIGLTGYLMVFITPFILARSGMTSPMFESRSQQSDGIFSSISQLMSTNLSVIASETMNFFNLDNEECKLEISCRLGKMVSNSIPYLNYVVKQSGAANWIERKYMANMVRSMTDIKECENICDSLKSSDKKSYSLATYSSDAKDSVKNVIEWLG